jgi:hypothetical protein
MSTAAVPKNANADRVRAEWLSRLAELVELVQAWSQEFGWATRRIEKRLQESQLGTYQAPALLMQKEFARVLLEPIARFAPGVEGVVDLYLMPAYDDIASLSFHDGVWRVHSWPRGERVLSVDPESNPVPLSKESLRAILDEMSNHAS